jgi:hypothetical protein
MVDRRQPAQLVVERVRIGASLGREEELGEDGFGVARYTVLGWR